MGSISKPDADVSVAESVCGIGLMLATFTVAVHVMFSVATLAGEAARSPFLELL